MNYKSVELGRLGRSFLQRLAHKSALTSHVPCVVMTELGLCLSSLTAQPALGTLPPLPGSDDSRLFSSSSLTPLLLPFPTATKANNRPKQFQSQAISFFTQKSMVSKGYWGGAHGWGWRGRLAKLQRGAASPGPQVAWRKPTESLQWSFAQVSERFLPPRRSLAFKFRREFSPVISGAVPQTS